MKKYLSLFLFFFFINDLFGELPGIDFKDAKNMDLDTKTFFQRLVRYTCDGGLKHSLTKKYTPRIYDYSVFYGKNIEYSFRLSFDRADNHAEFTITKKPDGEISAFIAKDTRSGLCLLGKFYLQDIEAYETHLDNL